MSPMKLRLLVGTILSTVVLGSAHASLLDRVLVIAQAAQVDQDKEKEKKLQQRPSPPQERRERQVQPPPTPPGQEQRRERQVQPPPTPPGQERRQERQVQPPPTLPGQERRQERQVQPPPTLPGQERRQERQVQPPPTLPGQERRQERQVQPPQSPPQQQQVQPPSLPQERRQERQVQPPQSPQQQQQVQPPTPPSGQDRRQERQVQPPQSPQQQQQVQPPAPPSGQDRRQERQVQPPQSPQQQQQVQPPAQGVQPSPGQQQGQGGTGDRTVQPPPRPIAPQQPVGKPAIAPSAVQLPPPPPGSQAAQVQRAFVPPPAQDNARRLDDVRGARREVREGDRLLIEEPGRVIIQQGGQTIIRHNEDDRFRWQAQNVHIERRGADMVTVFERPDGSRVYTVTDESGRLLRRYRRLPDGREIIIIDNRYSGPPSPFGYFVDLPAPVIRIPRERYIVEDEYARPSNIYGALWAAPVDYIDRPYTLDEIRYSLPLRERMPRVDLNTVTFETGSWEVAPDQVEHLAVIADGINRAIAANPGEVFLIEGHTDAVGSDIDNLSLSDRRAESVALVLSQQFGVPPENLTTQGYGAHYLKIPTQGPERANRRVTVRRITPLLTGQNQPLPLAPQ
jgi:outer membrane protein OmpA-like peptidoglycan-associated protein